jgi:Fe-S-cluster containining protein
MEGWPSTPCIEKKCSVCCHDTAMPLSPSDVLRLAARSGQHPNAFSRESDGIRILINTEAGACTFLSPDGLCTVYADRPIGCRTYPLILDAEDEAFLDELCPHRADFPEVPPGLMLMLARLDAELQGQA